MPAEKWQERLVKFSQIRTANQHNVSSAHATAWKLHTSFPDLYALFWFNSLYVGISYIFMTLFLIFTHNK